jgi:hypothetical protein
LANEVVFIAGDTLNYRELANTIDQVLNRKVERVEWPLPMLRDDLIAAPDDSIRKYRAVFAEGKGVAWPKADSYNAKKKINTMTVSQWIKQHLL